MLILKPLSKSTHKLAAGTAELDSIDGGPGETLNSFCLPCLMKFRDSGSRGSANQTTIRQLFGVLLKEANESYRSIFVDEIPLDDTDNFYNVFRSCPVTDSATALELLGITSPMDDELPDVYDWEIDPCYYSKVPM